MSGIVSQFIALQRAAMARAEGWAARYPERRAMQYRYEALANAIAALPLDDLSGEPALEPDSCQLTTLNHVCFCSACVKARNAGPQFIDAPDYAHPLMDEPVTPRLSQVGGRCIYCNEIVGEPLKCSGCGHVDPATVGS